MDIRRSVLLLGLVLGLTACGGDNETTTTTAGSVAPGLSDAPIATTQTQEETPEWPNGLVWEQIGEKEWIATKSFNGLEVTCLWTNYVTEALSC